MFNPGDTLLCVAKTNKTQRCPNCGDLHYKWELGYSSQCHIETGKGSILSTLYGVCKKCADNHGNAWQKQRGLPCDE